MEQKIVQFVVTTISSFLNTCNNLCGDLVDALIQIHPCLQQWFTHLCVRWLERLAYTQGDGRNSQAILMARQFVRSVPKKMRSFNPQTTGPEGIGEFQHKDE